MHEEWIDIEQLLNVDIINYKVKLYLLYGKKRCNYGNDHYCERYKYANFYDGIPMIKNHEKVMNQFVLDNL